MWTRENNYPSNNIKWHILFRISIHSCDLFCNRKLCFIPISRFSRHFQSLIRLCKPFSAIIGSANLGVIKLEANNRRQYEISAITETISEVEEIASHVEQLKRPNISTNIALIDGMTLIYEANTALSGIELVTEVPKSNVEFYKRCTAYVSFLLPLKVPAREERHMDDGKHFTKSNVNVCYAAPRSKRRHDLCRNFFETVF